MVRPMKKTLSFILGHRKGQTVDQKVVRFLSAAGVTSQRPTHLLKRLLATTPDASFLKEWGISAERRHAPALSLPKLHQIESPPRLSAALRIPMSALSGVA